LKESFAKYASFGNITPIQVDVANEDSVARAAKDVERAVDESKVSLRVSTVSFSARVSRSQHHSNTSQSQLSKDRSM
jgi:hypothetical protein